MANSFAYIVLFSWPIVVVILFKVLDRSSALIVSIVAGYLLLPNEAALDLPVLPVFNKTLIPVLAAAIMCLAVEPRGSSSPKKGRGASYPASGKEKSGAGKAVLIVLLAALFAASFGSVATNSEPLQFGPLFLPGMRIYDAFSISLEILVAILPLLLGWRYLATEADHRKLLAILALSGVVYSLPALFEVRMSPQLNIWIYGFFAHEFDQHIRAGGFRPIVFLQHGLWVGIFLSTATLAGAVLLRSSSVAASTSLRWMIFLAWMLVTLVLVKSLGALAITLILLPVILFGNGWWMRRVASIVALIVLVYPMLRGLDWVPVDTVSELATEVNPERGASFDVRVHNEDVLLAHAQEKPLFGWGGWGRNELYDPETGRNIVITDGIWVIFVGQFGWFGYITRFGLLTFPLLALVRKGKKQPIPLVTSGLGLVLAGNLIDLIPNATLTPLTWLMAGALAGYVSKGQEIKAATPGESQPAENDGLSDAILVRQKNVRKPRT